MEVTNPAQQKILGEKSDGYIVTYHPPKGVCQGPCEKITLTQAYVVGTWPYRRGPAFDAKDEPINKDRIYPIYGGQQVEGAISLADRPYYSGAFSYALYDMTVCAICTTTLRDRSGGYTIAVEQVLGCVSFQWKDRNPPSLIYGGSKYTNPSTKKGIAAGSPQYPWGKGVETR